MGKVNPRRTQSLGLTVLVNSRCTPGSAGTPPGTSVRKNKPNYKANCEARKNQKSPAAPSRKVHKGPTHRASGCTGASWTAIMDGQAKR